MATVTWLNADGNINNTANYSTGAKPSNGDSLDIPKADQTVTTNPTGLGAINLLNSTIGVAFTGQWGSTSAPITYGTCTGTLKINAPRAGLISVAPTAWPSVQVVDCGASQSPLYFSSGTYTDLVILGGGLIIVGASCTVTNLHVIGGQGTRPSPNVRIDAGAAVTNLYAQAGNIDTYAAITNSKISGTARLNYLGDSAINSTTVEVYGSLARMDVYAQGTHSSVKAFAGGVFDASKDSRTKTVTAAYAHTNSTIILGSHVAFTTAVMRGGRILGVAPTSIEGSPDTLGFSA